MSGIDVDIHQVALTAQLVARLVLLPHDLSARGVNQIERYLEDLVVEGIGKLEVVLVDKPDLIVGVAVSLVVIDQTVAGGETERYGQEHSYVAEVVEEFHP